MRIRNTRLPRRTLLRGASVAMALPFLEAMRGRSVHAQPSTPARIFYFTMPNGVTEAEWTPKNTGENYDLPFSLKPLAGVQDHVNVLSNVQPMAANGDGPHSRATMAILTAHKLTKPFGVEVGGISADQVAANHLRSSGLMTPIHSLALAGEAPQPKCDGKGFTGVYCSSVSWSGKTTPAPREHRPGRVFERFASLTSGRVAATEAPSLWNSKAGKRSVLHYVNEHAKRLNSQLGSRDQAKLDEYLTSVSELELRISSSSQSTASSSCQQPEVIPETPSYLERHSQMIDLMFLAAQCDLTRVQSLMIGNGSSAIIYRHLGLKKGHHSYSHHGGAKASKKAMTDIAAYEVELYAGLIERLRDATDVDGNSMLQNSVVYMAGSMMDGNGHNRNRVPTLVAGSGGGVLNTGKHIMFNSREPMANVHIAILRAVGLTKNDFGFAGKRPAAGLVA